MIFRSKLFVTKIRHKRKRRLHTTKDMHAIQVNIGEKDGLNLGKHLLSLPVKHRKGNKEGKTTECRKILMTEERKIAMVFTPK